MCVCTRACMRVSVCLSSLTYYFGQNNDGMGWSNSGNFMRNINLSCCHAVIEM